MQNNLSPQKLYVRIFVMAKAQNRSPPFVDLPESSFSFGPFLFLRQNPQ